MRLMQRLFGMIMIPMCFMITSEDGGGDSSPSDSGSTDSGDSGSEASSDSSSDAGESSGGEDDGSPKSMLEAIEQGLENGGEKKEGAGQGAGADVEKDKTPEQKAAEALEMPQGLSVKAQERFKTLANKVKDAEQRCSALEQEVSTHKQYSTTFQNFVRDTGTNPQQLSMISQYLKAANSGDVQTEMNFLSNRMRELQLETGQSFDFANEAFDPLSEFPDIKQAVDSYQITREHALELARGRQLAQTQRAEQTQQSQQSQEVQAWVSNKELAVREMKEWEKSASKDPDYARIAPLIMNNKQALTWIVQNTAPNTWQTHLNLLYTQTKAALSAHGTPRSNSPRPLSGGGGRPINSGKAPRNMHEAMFPEG